MPRLSDFAFAEGPVPMPAAGEFLLAARFLSADPLQRWRMDESAHYVAYFRHGGLLHHLVRHRLTPKEAL